MSKKTRKTLPDDYLACVLEKPDADVEEQGGRPDWLDGIPEDYLSTLRPETGTTPGVKESPKGSSRRKKPVSRRSRKRPGHGTSRTRQPAARKKERMGFHLPAGICKRLRRAALRLPRTPRKPTLSGIVEAALSRELRRLEKKYNGGKPF